MININEHSITQAVLQRLDNCDNPRLKTVMTSLVKHLHEFAREVQLSEEEWMAGIQFLTATGHKCDDKRQEFILLSDTLGLSMLTVAMLNAKPAGATEATVFGPFHIEHPPEYAGVCDITDGASGEPLFVSARVLNTRGEPVAGARVNVWQADADGLYDVQRPGLQKHQACGIVHTDDHGRLGFQTVLPVSYPVPTDGPVGEMLLATGRHPWRPAHVHFKIDAPGYQSLITHVFRDDDEYLQSDVAFGVRSSLLGKYLRHEAGEAPDGHHMDRPFYMLSYDFVLAPAVAA
ncbi:MAG: hydroxyquinol 1,2-dioxygenase [Limnohabitans sp.]|nr:hydroxyquinol 1,2-dioxygenase [Limnohabitans sp.]